MSLRRPTFTRPTAAARREKSGARLDLDDARATQRGNALQQLVIAEHRAREEHASKSPIDRLARVVDPRYPTGKTAAHTRLARELSEKVEILRGAGFRTIQIDEMQLLGTLCDESARSGDKGATRVVRHM